jgi:hypothetical protein
MSKVPGTPAIPVGGVLLNTTPQQPQPTQHKTTFHGCVLGIYVVLGENNECVGYKLIVNDIRNAHLYEADFGQDILDEWAADFQKFPRIGERPEGIDEPGPDQ